MKKLYKVPAKVANNALDGLVLREMYNRGGTEVGEATARRLVKAKERDEWVDYKFVKKISQYFPRHAGDNIEQNGGDGKKPSNGYIAWMLWGGDEGWAWSNKIVEKVTSEGK